MSTLATGGRRTLGFFPTQICRCILVHLGIKCEILNLLLFVFIQRKARANIIAK